MVWTAGAGGYGDGWGDVGKGIIVRQGGTLYIKYYSGAGDASLNYADHGRKLEGWHSLGPALGDGVGLDINEPVILKISGIGTPQSTVAWVNGKTTSGIWSGPTKPGPYDLALHERAKWTSPPLVITDAPKKPPFWARLLGAPETVTTTSRNSLASVPEGGATVTLLVLALVSLAVVRRIQG